MFHIKCKNHSDIQVKSVYKDISTALFKSSYQGYSYFAWLNCLTNKLLCRLQQVTTVDTLSQT